MLKVLPQHRSCSPYERLNRPQQPVVGRELARPIHWYHRRLQQVTRRHHAIPPLWAILIRYDMGRPHCSGCDRGCKSRLGRIDQELASKRALRDARRSLKATHSKQTSDPRSFHGTGCMCSAEHLRQVTGLSGVPPFCRCAMGYVSQNMRKLYHLPFGSTCKRQHNVDKKC